MRCKVSNFTSGSVVLISLCLGVFMFLNGCRGPKVLNDRGNVPSPTLAPGENANELANQQNLELPIGANEQIKLSDETIKSSSGAGEGSSSLVNIKSSKPVHYTVKKGDSFWKIAKMYDVSMKELAAYNKMDLNKKLKYGTVLEIPPGGLLSPKVMPKRKVSSRANKITTTALTAGGAKYTVKRGDSLWSVSKKNGTTVKALAEANGISPKTHLIVGQKLVIPRGTKPKNKIVNNSTSVKSSSVKAKNDNKNKVTLSNDDKKLLDGITAEPNAPSKPVEVSPDVTASISTPSYLPHTVKDGDTWSTVSDMYGVSVADLKKANPKIASDKELKVGSVVNIPEE
ncbi:MAG TPA: LysM peptidoglycan-binding domain-containing protein [Victivallales bacterium]|nr:LysM peptidoglycan-binding domain-containing protein [Victivallales bacterium]